MKRKVTREKQTHIRVFVSDKKKLEKIVANNGLANIAFAIRKILRRK